jgi:hypothetical protein
MIFMLVPLGLAVFGVVRLTRKLEPRQRAIPIAVAVVVAIVTSMAAFGIMFAATWSLIHSGRTDRPGSLEIAMVYAGLLVPAALAFFAGWATHLVMGRKAGPSNLN